MVFINLLMVVGFLLVPSALIINLLAFLLAILLKRMEVIEPLRDLIQIMFTNILRLAGGGLVLYVLSVPVRTIITVVITIVLTVIIGSVLTGIARDIVSAILLVRQFGLRPGLKLRFYDLYQNASKVITIEKLGLLHVQGIFEDKSIGVLPYWYLQQIGFEILEE